MKNAIVEKAREFGVPVVLVNPSHTSTVCPVHGTKIVYQPDGAVPKGWVFVIGGESCGIGTWLPTII